MRHFNFDIPTATEGDCYARYLVRVEEMRQSLRIIEQAASQMPAGRYVTDDYRTLSPKRRYAEGYRKPHSSFHQCHPGARKFRGVKPMPRQKSPGASRATMWSATASTWPTACGYEPRFRQCPGPAPDGQGRTTADLWPLSARSTTSCRISTGKKNEAIIRGGRLISFGFEF